jgi:hypothetical protein
VAHGQTPPRHAARKRRFFRNDPIRHAFRHAPATWGTLHTLAHTTTPFRRRDPPSLTDDSARDVPVANVRGVNLYAKSADCARVAVQRHSNVRPWEALQALLGEGNNRILDDEDA